MKRKRLWFFCGAICALVLLLLLLVAVESAAPEATIVSFPRAVWYALTTLTTVGYGDLFPVTAAGRAIGVVFQLMSLGVLGALFGTLFSFLNGRALPLLQLRRRKGKPWYVFSAISEGALALARGLLEEDGSRIILFPLSEGDQPPEVGLGLRLTVEEICRRKDPQTEGYLFCLTDDEAQNETLAEAFGPRFTRTYCRTDAPVAQLPPEQVRVSLPACCARLYWEQHPLTSPKERIVLIGDGPYAEALLEQGLQQNVVDDRQAVCYTVFGPFEGFRRNHPFLSRLFAEAPEEDQDCLRFMEGPWNGNADELLAADRIILCCQSEERTRQIASDLLRFFPVSAAVHARLSSPMDRVAPFGSLQELFTPALILGEALDRTAQRLHARYRESNPAAPAWEELSDFLRRSNLSSADHLSVKRRILAADGEKLTPPERDPYAVFAASAGERRARYRRIEHMRWMRFHMLNNWQYAPVRDNARRLHPLLVPFDALDEADQIKDDYAWELLELTDPAAPKEAL